MNELPNDAVCRRCGLCIGKESSYCAPYLGPNNTRPKILFIGLDHGNAESGSPTREERRRAVLDYYRNHGNRWNPHYKGCIWVASHLRSIRCSDECRVKCMKHEEPDCALTGFDQANAVRCVEEKTRMAFTGHRFIDECFPLLFENEIPELRPDIIVLQGKPLHTAFYKHAKTCDPREQVVIDQHIGRVVWKSGKTSFVLAFKHPSALGRHHFKYQWVEIETALGRLREIAPGLWL